MKSLPRNYDLRGENHYPNQARIHCFQPKLDPALGADLNIEWLRPVGWALLPGALNMVFEGDGEEDGLIAERGSLGPCGKPICWRGMKGIGE